MRTALDIATVFTLDRISLPGMTFPTLLQLSQKLYYYDMQITNQRSYLEAYLYFVLYNFPTRERLRHDICLVPDLIAAIDKWRLAFSKNYPKSGLPETSRKRRETTLFFLGNGQPLHDIVFIDTHEMIKLYSVHENWQSLDIRQRLRMHTGVLGEGGNEVTLNISGPKGNALPLKIPTAYPIKSRNMFQKKINFYIGFSFCGPKAFGMSSDEHQNDTVTRFSFEPPVTQRNWKSQMTLKQMIDALKGILCELGKTKLDPSRRVGLERERDDISKVMRKLIDG
ncbi:unnamed protein product [Lymnaea stagnalis]|uniref:Uncharacterized protein n=1 Tax=Lymnaea stagnalis TaxID=6523 RepID=A0AAV2I8J3_LYMST